ncbi:MAG: biofilm regulation diguanylate cyclase SiaD [Wenzhouxiangellaceae bacterium]|nr:biofilm regulation diguanylate cyclase SiaD [Wenzhouxiangellaceae bacterium]
MTDAERADIDSSALLTRIERALADDEHSEHPLAGLLESLLAAYRHQQHEMARLIRISDGYHGITRESFDALVRKSERQARQLDKLIRISDRYQNSLHELSDALEHASLTDVLTGIGNRRYLLKRLDEERQRAARGGNPFALILLDIDHFKRFNDTWGHAFGDLVLKTVGDCLQSNMRSCDLYGRWGGEEFLCLLPDTGPAQAYQSAERLRRMLHTIRFDAPHDQVRVTASFGVAAWRDPEDIDALLRRVDDLLYSAKDEGRDRVLLDDRGGSDDISADRP